MKKHHLLPTLISVLLLLVVSHSESAVILSGDFQTGSPTPTLDITADITFNIIANGLATYLVFDEWVVSDGSGNAVSFLTIGPGVQNISYSLNGGSVTSAQAFQFFDNNASDFGDISENDGWLDFDSSSFALTAGDMLTIAAATYTFNFNADFNPAVPSNFTGNAYIADGSGNRLSSNVAVPEPTTGLLVVLAGGLLALRRRQFSDCR
ncbi:MAG: PEP-CTERM sorting domain-containing protein [Verrucomicrobiota bacterium]